MTEYAEVGDARRRRGWFYVDNVVIDRFGEVIKAPGLALYVALCRRGNATGECVVGIERLSRDAGLSRSSVKKYTKELVSAGLIAVESRFDDAEQLCHRYVLLDVWPAVKKLGPERLYESPDTVEDGALLPVPDTPVGGSVARRPGVARKPGGQSPRDLPRSPENHLKTNPLKNKQEKKNEISDSEESLEDRDLLRFVADQLRIGWTVRSLIEAGRLDAAAWERAKQSWIRRTSEFARVEFK